MPTFTVHHVLKDRILVSRESARLLEGPLRVAMQRSEAPAPSCDTALVAIDFIGVEGIAPSFLDELISIFESILSSSGNQSERRLMVANPPTRLSLKFEAIARGHGMSAQVLADGSWLLT